MIAKESRIMTVMLSLCVCLLWQITGVGNSNSIESDEIDKLLDLARDEDALNALLKAKTIRCFLGRGCTADWVTGDPNLSIGQWRKKTEDRIMIFDSIDLKKGTARFVGGLGSVDVQVAVTPEGMTFFETTDSGNLMITTVFASYKKGTKDHIFVHSRHASFFGSPLPSQYHGLCKTFE